MPRLFSPARTAEAGTVHFLLPSCGSATVKYPFSNPMCGATRVVPPNGAGIGMAGYCWAGSCGASGMGTGIGTLPGVPAGISMESPGTNKSLNCRMDSVCTTPALSVVALAEDRTPCSENTPPTCDSVDSVDAVAVSPRPEPELLTTCANEDEPTPLGSPTALDASDSLAWLSARSEMPAAPPVCVSGIEDVLTISGYAGIGTPNTPPTSFGEATKVSPG